MKTNFFLSLITFLPLFVTAQKYFVCAPDKMNVFYLGVDNPVSIGAVNCKIIAVETQNGTTSFRKGQKYFNVNPEKVGECILNFKSDDGDVMKYSFRVKRISDPKAQLFLDDKAGKTHMSATDFQTSKNVLMNLPDFDFEAQCVTTNYTLTRVDGKGRREKTEIKGSRYSDEAKAVISKATTGDIFIYNEIGCKCPGDDSKRELMQNITIFID